MLLHADKLRWLFWLRWKMFSRGFTRGSGRVSRIIGSIVLLLFGIPFLGGIAVGTFFAYRRLPSPANTEILFVVLTGMYLLWIALPLLEFSVNEGLDISKLALFPLTRAELMLSLIFSTLLDIPTLGLFIVFGAVVVGWWVSWPLGLMALLTMLVFYVQVVAISQLVLALLMRTLQSRRFRDLSIIIVALFSSSCYLIQQVVIRGIGATNIVGSLTHATISPYLQWLPPGMAARAIQQAYIGNWGASFVWLLALAAISVVLLLLWQQVVERGLSSANSEGSARVRRRRNTQQAFEADAVGVTATGNGLIGRILSSQAFAIAAKDAKYFRRDPQLQATIVSSITSIFVLIVVVLVNGGNGFRGFTGTWIVLVAPAFIFFSLYTFSSNLLGLERQSLTTLFLFPVDPKQILWGKNIIVFALGAFEMCLMVLLAAFASHGWNLVVPALVVGFAGIGVVLGCGNFSSVFFPQRMRQFRRGMQTTTTQSTEGSVVRIALSFLALLVTAIVLIPVIAALLIPVLLHVQWIWDFTIPLSLVYGIAFYVTVTLLVAPRIFDRVPEILATVAREV